MAVASFGPGANHVVARVRRSWKSVTISGLRTTISPQVQGATPCVSTAEIGSTVSIAT